MHRCGPLPARPGLSGPSHVPCRTARPMRPLPNFSEMSYDEWCEVYDDYQSDFESLELFVGTEDVCNLNASVYQMLSEGNQGLQRQASSHGDKRSSHESGSERANKQSEFSQCGWRHGGSDSGGSEMGDFGESAPLDLAWLLQRCDADMSLLEMVMEAFEDQGQNHCVTMSTSIRIGELETLLTSAVRQLCVIASCPITKSDLRCRFSLSDRLATLARLTSKLHRKILLTQSPRPYALRLHQQLLVDLPPRKPNRASSVSMRWLKRSALHTTRYCCAATPPPWDTCLHLARARATWPPYRTARLVRAAHPGPRGHGPGSVRPAMRVGPGRDAGQACSRVRKRAAKDSGRPVGPPGPTRGLSAQADYRPGQPWRAGPLETVRPGRLLTHHPQVATYWRPAAARLAAWQPQAGGGKQQQQQQQPQQAGGVGQGGASPCISLALDSYLRRGEEGRGPAGQGSRIGDAGAGGRGWGGEYSVQEMLRYIRRGRGQG